MRIAGLSMKKNELERKLQGISAIDNPKPDLEQYSTPASVAADVLFLAYSRGDIEGRKVADLGCGNGIFAIGAALLGASSVTAIDIDSSCIATAMSNAESLGVVIDYQNIAIDHMDVQVDTVIQNPPFGAQKRRADRPFIEKAMTIGKVIYSLHMAETEDFLQNMIESSGGVIAFQKSYKFEIPHMFAFHRKKKKDIEVVLLCIEMGEKE